MSKLGRMTVNRATFDNPQGKIEDLIWLAIETAGQPGFDAIGGGDEIGALISFQFNGVEILLRADSDPRLVLRDYQRAVDGSTGLRTVGPYPKPFLSSPERKADRLRRLMVSLDLAPK